MYPMGIVSKLEAMVEIDTRDWKMTSNYDLPSNIMPLQYWFVYASELNYTVNRPTPAGHMFQDSG